MSCYLRCLLPLLLQLLLWTSSVSRAQVEKDPFGGGANDPFGGRVQLRQRFPADDPFGEPPVEPAKDSAVDEAATDDNDDEIDIPTQPREPGDPDVFAIRFHDGMEIKGKLSIDEIQVATSFGSLSVPLEKIHKFTPGLESRVAHYAQIRQWIDELGSADTAQRNQAQAQLRALGLPIRKELELTLDDPDLDRADTIGAIFEDDPRDGDRGAVGPHRTDRIRTILEQLDALAAESEDGWLDDVGENQWLRSDVVDTTQFQAHGRITPSSFDVTTKYGTINVRLEDVQWLRGSEIRREDARKSFSLNGQYLAQLKYKNTGIEVEPGDKISVRASGQISRAGSSSYVSTPAGSARFGNFLPTIQGGTLVARLGGKGTVIGVGSQKTFTAKKPGTLQFAIGMRPDYVGRYQFPGEYKVTVKVERGDP